MDTSAPGSFGAARRVLKKVKIPDLKNQLNVKYYLAGRDCGGGSPRIQLAVDLDGDGVSDGNAFGYAGPSPSFSGCTPNSWQFEDLTDGVLRWDLTQFGGAFYNTWSNVETFFAAYPDHRVLRGSLVDDSAWLLGAAGVAYYDLLSIGEATFSDSDKDD